MTEPNDVAARLRSLSDPEYRAFVCRLLPTVDPERILGVRTPPLRELARRLPEREAADFLARLPHRFYEEDNLHGFLIERMKDFDDAVAALDVFLPCVDNWATCDSILPRAFRRRARPSRRRTSPHRPGPPQKRKTGKNKAPT